ncbi:MAG TPA: hypothetical protein VG476_12585 [Acidimicrobiales bacterium]|nr:hypothetical protein [Acidimicrobiales bacterium]
MKGYLNVALDWTPRDGTSQHWLTRRTYDYTRHRVKSTGSAQWEVETYVDVHGNIEVRNARTGDVLWSGKAPGSEVPDAKS